MIGEYPGIIGVTVPMGQTRTLTHGGKEYFLEVIDYENYSRS